MKGGGNTISQSGILVLQISKDRYGIFVEMIPEAKRDWTDKKAVFVLGRGRLKKRLFFQRAVCKLRNMLVVARHTGQPKKNEKTCNYIRAQENLLYLLKDFRMIK